MMKRWIGVIGAVLLALMMSLLAGENPLNVAKILFESAFGTSYDFGLTLAYTTPLIFTGLSVAIAFHAGLFNIGGEGQLLLATASMTAIGVFFPNLPSTIAPLTAILIGVSSGALWGGFAGWLRAYRGSHEVITTILLNFIAAGLTSWFVLEIIPNPNSQNPESALVASQFQLKDYDLLVRALPDSKVNFSFFVAITLAVVIWFLIFKTKFGFMLRAVGTNSAAAERAGINSKKIHVQAMILAGGLASGVALHEVIGSTGQFKIGFSPEYGFMGIAVALMARNNPLGIILSAFFIASLHKGASALDLETESITRDFSKILQALIILGVGIRAFPVWKKSGTQNKNQSKNKTLETT